MSAGKRSARYLHHNRVKLIPGGTSYFSVLENMIAEAKYVVQMQVYIFDDDFTGNTIADALMRAALRGVKVYLMVDGYASQGLSKTFVRRMKNAGVHVHFFQPLLKSRRFYFGRRMHQKVVVVDAAKALVGGINVADRYNDVDSEAWLDYAVYIEGEAAASLNKICFDFWKHEKFDEEELPGVSQTLPQADETTCSVRIRRNDWVRGKNEIWRSYFNLFAQAQQSITVMCSYFLPGRVLRRQLAKAAARGVDVKLILAGPSDVMMAKHAERYLYPLLLKSKIRIFEYQPTVLHAKMALADNRWMTIGSFNVNNISAYASAELNLDVRNRQFVAEVKEKLDLIIDEHCVEVTDKNFATNATVFTRFVQRSAYEFIRLVLNLSTFYFRHE
ncbi:MAG: phospholipase D-like domain-containing protein [Flavisolibacter sp.]